MVKVVLILAALVGSAVSGGAGVGFGLNFALGGGHGGPGSYVGGYGAPGHQTILVNHPPRFLVASPVAQALVSHHHQHQYQVPVQQYVHQAPIVTQAPLYAPVHAHQQYTPVHSHYSAPHAHHVHQAPIAYGPPPTKVYSLGARLNLDLGGHGGYAYAAEAPVVKTTVIKKPVVSHHNYDHAPFKPIVGAKTVKAVYKTPVYEAPSDFSITPSISYGYSYKLVPTHSYGPVHSSVPEGKGLKSHGSHGAGIGLDLGYNDIGHGQGYQ